MKHQQSHIFKRHSWLILLVLGLTTGLGWVLGELLLNAPLFLQQKEVSSHIAKLDSRLRDLDQRVRIWELRVDDQGWEDGTWDNEWVRFLQDYERLFSEMNHRTAHFPPSERLRLFDRFQQLSFSVFKLQKEISQKLRRDVSILHEKLWDREVFEYWNDSRNMGMEEIYEYVD